MHRVFLPPSAIHGDRATVSDARARHHLRDVLRLAPGDQVECFDGQGAGYVAVIERAGPRAVELKLLKRREDHAPAALRITVAQALIRPERFEWAIEKMTELGVARIVPLVTARTVVRPVAARSTAKIARWRRIAQEAARQCGRADLPAVEEPQPLAAFVPSLAGVSHALMPTLAVPGPLLREALSDGRPLEAVTVLIGPEGDFTEEEIQLAQRSGARPVSLGALTLRAETAATAIVAMLRYHAGL